MNIFLPLISLGCHFFVYTWDFGTSRPSLGSWFGHRSHRKSSSSAWRGGQCWRWSRDFSIFFDSSHYVYKNNLRAVTSCAALWKKPKSVKRSFENQGIDTVASLNFDTFRGLPRPKTWYKTANSIVGTSYNLSMKMWKMLETCSSQFVFQKHTIRWAVKSDSEFFLTLKSWGYQRLLWGVWDDVFAGYFQVILF